MTCKGPLPLVSRSEAHYTTHQATGINSEVTEPKPLPGSGIFIAEHLSPGLTRSESSENLRGLTTLTAFERE